MSNDDQTKNRVALNRILEDVEKSAPEIEQLGQELASAGRFTRDVVKTVREFVSEIPNDDLLAEEDWKRMKEGWGAVQDTAQPVLKTKIYVQDFSAVVSGSTVSTLPFVYRAGPLTTPPLRAAVKTMEEQLAQILEGVPLMDEVRKSMLRLRLDSLTGQRSAVQLLEDAKSGLDRPQTLAADGAHRCLYRCGSVSYRAWLNC